MKFFKTTFIVSLVTLLAGIGTGCSFLKSKPFPDGPETNWEKGEKYFPDQYENTSFFLRQTTNHFCFVSQKTTQLGLNPVMVGMYLPKDKVLDFYMNQGNQGMYTSIKFNPDVEFSSFKEFWNFMEEMNNNLEKHPKVQEVNESGGNIKDTFTQSKCWNNTESLSNRALRNAIENTF